LTYHRYQRRMASTDSSSAELEQNARKCPVSPDAATNGRSSPKRASQTSSDSGSAKQKKTKFVVRKIPDFVTEEDIKSHLAEFEGLYTWFLWTRQPDIPNPTRRQKKRFQRFYIRFVTFSAAVPFIEKFQKLVFKEADDEKTESRSGFEQYALKNNATYKLCVEFAPNQSMPSEVATRDRRINTIDADEDYKAFLQGLDDRQKEIEALRKRVEATSMRKHVMDMNQCGDPRAHQKVDDDAPVAPLAKHVATLRHRRQILAKKISRASLVKSERAKERNLERVREMRRRKRSLVKNKKYRSTQWIAKHGGGGHDHFDDEERERTHRDRARSHRKGKGRGRGARFAPSRDPNFKGKGKRRRFKVNPKYLKKYADQHQGDEDEAGGGEGPRARDPESYDVRDRRDRAMRRRPDRRVRGGAKRRGRGKRSGKGKAVRRNSAKRDLREEAGDSFNGYSRKRGHQTWQRAR